MADDGGAEGAAEEPARRQAADPEAAVAQQVPPAGLVGPQPVDVDGTATAGGADLPEVGQRGARRPQRVGLQVLATRRAALGAFRRR
jgi:hypothetical protein